MYRSRAQVRDHVPVQSPPHRDEEFRHGPGARRRVLDESDKKVTKVTILVILLFCVKVTKVIKRHFRVFRHFRVVFRTWGA